MKKVSSLVLDHEETVAERIRRILLSEVAQSLPKAEDETTFAPKGTY